MNPGWDVRCLDATSIERYIPLRDHVDLANQSLTAASLSDVVRILLLREFGGVWADATLFCNRPLDEWLPAVMGEGFFAFAAPGPGRPLSSWFLSAESSSYLVSAWCRATLRYWARRPRSDDYFWLHHLFRDLIETDPVAAESWARVPKISADGPHALQFGDRLSLPASEAAGVIDWETPVFKLTHRLPQDAGRPGSLLAYLLQEDVARLVAEPMHVGRPVAEAVNPFPTSFAALRVSTENVGDHIQIAAALRLLSRLGVKPDRLIDRDDEIRSAPGLDPTGAPVGILLNGWFKTNGAEWPPHPRLSPIMFGFHIRPFQTPELLSEESLAFFRRFGPIGARDAFTQALLQARNVDAFVSNCVSLTLPRRTDDPQTQTEVFVVSRDERIRDLLPASLGSHTFVNHYSGSHDFPENMARAQELLGAYRDRARLIVTTLLHCALPALAMGIPVIVFYPLNDDAAHASDHERFSTLAEMMPVYHVEEMDRVDWHPRALDVGTTKLGILNQFYDMAERWRVPAPPPIGPIAPPSVLPPP